MVKKRRPHSSSFKAKVALSAVRGLKTMSELASDYDVHPQMIAQWKKKLLSEAEEIFERPGSKSKQNKESNEAELYQQIGKLQMELEWLKKKSELFD